jgi:tetratricopeptide (TPR) repeat protein
MHRTLRCLAPLLLAVCAACGGAGDRLAQARDLALAGHHRAALLEARALLFALPDRRDEATEQIRRGALKLAGDLCALHLDSPQSAANEYRQLVRRYPTAPEALEARERLGDLYLRIGDPAGALEAFTDQVAAAPDRPGADDAQLKIARILSDQGRYETARAAAAELVARWPESPRAPIAALMAAATWHLEQRHGEAIAAYRKVARTWPGTTWAAEALFEEGNCLVEQGEEQQALKSFLAALVRHESPQIVQLALERTERRLDLQRIARPGNLAEAFERRVAQGRTHAQRQQ